MIVSIGFCRIDEVVLFFHVFLVRVLDSLMKLQPYFKMLNCKSDFLTIVTNHGEDDPNVGHTKGRES